MERLFVGLSLERYQAAAAKPVGAGELVRQSERSEKALRCTVLKNILEEDYREMSVRLAQSELFRWFCKLPELEAVRVPGKSTLQEYANWLPHEEMKKVLAQLREAMADEDRAKEIGLEAELDMLLNSLYAVSLGGLPELKTANLPPSGVVEFYSGEYYQGSMLLEFDSAGEYNIAQFGNIGSVSLCANIGITIFSGENCSGVQRTYFDDIQDFALENISEVKSVKIVQKNEPINLISRAAPINYYVSGSNAATDSTQLYMVSGAGQFNENNASVPATEERLKTLTDGAAESKNLFYRGTDQRADKCLVLIYDLGGICELNSIKFAGISGSYRVGAVRFYAANSLGSLFENGNRVDMFGESELILPVLLPRICICRMRVTSLW